MKKLYALILALALMLAAVSAFADSGAAVTIVDAGEDLLYRTENVTVTGEATFLLDSVVFKRAEVKYVQDGTNSLWQLKLRTPRPDKSEPGDKESGYTIIANGGDVYVIEAVLPGFYKTTTTFPQSTILRQSVELDLMNKLVHNLAKQADALLGENAMTAAETADGGTEIRIVMGEDVPDIVNTAMSMVYQYLAKRYKGVNYDQVSSQYMGPIANYMTVTQGILYTTEYMYLKQADITVVLDAAEELQAVSGSASVYLQTGGDGQHQLDVTFTLDISGRGTSTVERFDPDAWGVSPVM